MEQYFQDVLERLEKLHGEIDEAVKGLPQEAIDWIPGPKLNSLGVLLAHTAGAEGYWLVDIITAQRSERVRESEFETRGTPVDVLLSRLHENIVSIQHVLRGLNLADLSKIKISPRDGREFTIGWCLLHGFEHTAQHTGHIQITRQFWDLSRKNNH